MTGISIRSVLLGAVLASGLTLGGMVVANSDMDMENGGMMGMMSQMQDMMSRCNAMMDSVEDQAANPSPGE